MGSISYELVDVAVPRMADHLHLQTMCSSVVPESICRKVLSVLRGGVVEPIAHAIIYTHRSTLAEMEQ